MVPGFILELPTPRLLAYFKKHYRNRRGHMQFAYDTGSVDKEWYDEFMQEYDAIKDELDNREHVE